MSKEIKEEIKKKNKALKPVVFILFSLLSLFLIFLAFYLVYRHYRAIYPPIGNDFYHSFNLINFFDNNFAWPHLSWRYIWHFGGPSIIAYPWLNFYLVQPLVDFFGLLNGTLYYFLGTIFLYGGVSYFIFYRLSKSILLSLGLSVSLIWSATTWRLVSAGSLTLTANLFFLALALLFIIIYLQKKNRKFLLLSGLVSGLSIISQSGSGFPFIIPVISLVIIFWWQEGEKFWQIKRKISDFLIYIISAFLVASFYVYFTFSNVLSGRGSFDVFEWMKEEAFSSIFTKSNPALFMVLALLVMLAVAFKGFKKIKILIPFIAGFLYIILFNLATIMGVNPFSSDLPPAENWHISTFLIAVIVACLWPVFILSYDKIKNWHKWLLSGACLLILITPFGYNQAIDQIDEFADSNLVCGVEDEDYVDKALYRDDFSGLGKTFPDWFEDEKNHRFFSLSWCVDLWFNTFYQMPLTGGYDTLLVSKKSSNYINWTNEIFNGTMEQAGVDKEVIKNNMLFHIDWFAGRYLEQVGEFEYLKDEEIVNLDNKPEGYRFFEFNEDAVSPIIKPTNAPTLLVVSNQEGYDTILRILAQENINSKYLIPIQGPEYMEDLLNYDLQQFDGVFLYDYKYKNEKNFSKYPEKPWQALDDFVKKGGRLFIETGSEVKESDIKNLPTNQLPEVFPVISTEREALGGEWDINVQLDDLFEGVDYSQFDDPLYQGDPWKMSHSSDEDIEDWAKTIFTHAGYPVMVSGDYQNGKVVWSGLNFPYHIKSYNNLEEGRLFNNLLDELFELTEERVMPFDFQRERSEQIEISTGGAKGILFKENFNSGWEAEQAGENLKIYKAGFGFMYVSTSSESTVTFNYMGEIKYQVMFYISALTFVLIIIYLIIGNKLSLGFKKAIKLDKMKEKTKSWWEKDEEE